MRIISGTAKGRKLFTPQDNRVRPTSDRVKEALFNILTSLFQTFEGIRVLDVCAGTGNLGLEALSRGAAKAIFIDNHRESADLIKKNITLLGSARSSLVLMKEASAALQLLGKSEPPVQLIFLDPPYRLGLLEKLLHQLSTSSLIDRSTIIVAEFFVKEHLPTEYGPLHEFDRRSYGDTSLAFFMLKSDENNEFK